MYRFNFCLLFLLTFAVPAISAAQELEPGRASGSVEETAIGSQDPSIMWAHYVAILECRVYGEPNLFLMFSEAPLSPEDVQDQTGKAFIVALKPKNNIEYLYMNGSDLLFIAKFLPVDSARSIQAAPADWKIDYKDYDWGLNE